MKKIKKTAIAMLLSVVTAVTSTGLFGCGEKIATAEDVTFWTVSATDKIMRDNTQKYEELMKESPVIDLKVIGGEVESSQIIMTTGDKKVDEYTVEVSSLTSGENEFGKENITVYHEKYFHLDGQEYYTEEGYYPDCLVPFEAVEKLDENFIDKNSNQGLYVSFDVPKDQPSGVYTGEIKITIGGKNAVVPVKLTVSSVSIGVENHSKSCFSVMWYHGKGELDYTPEMMDTYVKALMDYRLGANYIMYRSDDTDAEIAYYAKKVVEYAKMPESVNYGMQYRTTYINSYDMDGTIYEFTNPLKAYDEPAMLKYFLAFYEEGLKEGVDPFKKLFFKGLDEPQLFGDMSALAICSHIVHKVKAQAIEIMNGREVENTELLNQMHQSLLAMPHVITTPNIPEGIDTATMDITFCPYFSSCQTESSRAMYRDYSGELWWYGCNVPKAPFPTYHLDNTLISPRVLSWMQADYDVVGNLYWSCDYYANSYEDNMILEDQYEGAALRCTEAWGEGLLFYPGAKYGIDGPLPSMRIQAIRDGLEEYEMIYRLKEIYSAKGYDEDKIMRSLYDSMYGSAQLHSWIDTSVFESARNKLVSLLELAESDANLIFTNVLDARGKTVYEFFVKDGYEPKFSDSFESKSQIVDGGKIYSVECGSEEDAFELTVEVDGNTLDVSFDLNSVLGTFYNAEYFVDGNGVKSGSLTELTVETVKGNSVNASEIMDIDYACLNFAKATDVAQKVDITSSVISDMDSFTTKVIIELYYDSDAPLTVSLGYKCTNKKSITQITDLTLVKGVNKLVYEGMATIDWKLIGKIEAFRIEVGEIGDAARNDLYLVGVSIFNG